MQDYLDPALREHLGGFVPMERRNFFGIASHYEPMTLFAHFYHWFDHAWMKHAPHASPIRRGATLFNVWGTRSEGMATAMEELILHAGYYDDNPRAREIVWIMLAQRCARGLASLYAQANEFDIKQAKAFQVEWTPRGWMRPDLDLLGFEQQLYLRQPGYGIELRHRQVPDRRTDQGSRAPARRRVHAAPLLRRVQRRRRDPGTAHPLADDRPARGLERLTNQHLLPSQARDWAIHTVGQLPIGQLIVVARLALQSRELGLQRRDQRFLPGLAVQVVQLVRILAQVEQLPLVLRPEVDQLVRERANAVVLPRIVVAGIVVVAVVHRSPPVGRRAAPEHRQQAAPLHVRRPGSAAASRNVGAKSTFKPSASLLVPGLIAAGQRTRNGIRIDSSYMNRLSNMPWSPRKNPDRWCR